MAAAVSSHTLAMDGDNPKTFGVDTPEEWEYQYDENETEDLYFTLDVTTLQSQITSKAALGKGNKAPAQPNDHLQILDLHSDNPLVKLGDSFYSCHWSTDLGTQFYVAKPGVDENPLRRGYVLDVIGTSRARLTGEPVTLHRRRPDAPDKAVGPTNANAIVLDDDENAASAVSTPTATSSTQYRPMTKNINRLVTARQNARDPLVKAQASFLERLAIIKHKKGEKDAVPVYGIDTISESTASGGNAVTSGGNGKSMISDALERPVASGSSKKQLVSPPYGTSGFNGGPQTSQIQRWDSNNVVETRNLRPGDSNVDPQLLWGGTASIGTETGERSGMAQSGADENLSRESSGDAVQQTQAEAATTERPQEQP